MVKVLSLFNDCAGMLDSDEFALAMHLMNIKLDGKYPLLFEFFSLLVLFPFRTRLCAFVNVILQLFRNKQLLLLLSQFRCPIESWGWVGRPRTQIFLQFMLGWAIIAWLIFQAQNSYHGVDLLLYFLSLLGHDLPSELPTHLVPPSKRGF